MNDAIGAFNMPKERQLLHFPPACALAWDLECPEIQNPSTKEALVGWILLMGSLCIKRRFRDEVNTRATLPLAFQAQLFRSSNGATLLATIDASVPRDAQRNCQLEGGL